MVELSINKIMYLVCLSFLALMLSSVAQSNGAEVSTHDELVKLVSRLRFELRRIEPKSAQCSALSEQIGASGPVGSLIARQADGHEQPGGDVAEPIKRLIVASSMLRTHTQSLTFNNNVDQLAAFLKECANELGANKEDFKSIEAQVKASINQEQAETAPLDAGSLVEKATAELLAEKERLASQVSELDGQEARLESEVVELQSRVKSLSAMNEDSEKKLTNYGQQLGELKARADENTKAQLTSESKLKECAVEKLDFEKEKKKCEAKLEDLQVGHELELVRCKGQMRELETLAGHSSKALQGSESQMKECAAKEQQAKHHHAEQERRHESELKGLRENHERELASCKQQVHEFEARAGEMKLLLQLAAQKSEEQEKKCEAKLEVCLSRQRQLDEHRKKQEAEEKQRADREVELAIEETNRVKRKLLEPFLRRGACAQTYFNSWNYELCHGDYFRKYRENSCGRIIEDFYLGKMDLQKMLDSHEKAVEEQKELKSRPTILVGGRQKRYVMVSMTMGTKCDTTNRNREVKVFYVCDSNQRFALLDEIEETSPCVYEAIIRSPQVCEFEGYN